jgi:F0F1-type ATP synthase gamma subunit
MSINDITLEEIEERVVVLKNNEIYRFGDVLNGVSKISEVIKWNKKYKGSILERWLNDIRFNKQKKEDEKIMLLFEKAVDYTERHNLNVYSSDYFAIHVRAGDDYMNRGLGNKKILRQLYLDIIEENKKRPIKKIYLVTALHYGVAIESSIYTEKRHMYKYSEINKKQNFLAIQKFINSIDIPIEIFSSEKIDDDFCFVCTADRILTTGGGFSKIIKKVNLLFKTQKNSSSK